MSKPEDLPESYEFDGVIVAEKPTLTAPDRYHLIAECEADRPLCKTWLQHPEAEWGVRRFAEVPEDAELCRICDPAVETGDPGEINAHRIRKRVRNGEDPLGGQS